MGLVETYKRCSSPPVKKLEWQRRSSTDKSTIDVWITVPDFAGRGTTCNGRMPAKQAEYKGGARRTWLRIREKFGWLGIVVYRQPFIPNVETTSAQRSHLEIISVCTCACAKIVFLKTALFSGDKLLYLL